MPFYPEMIDTRAVRPAKAGCAEGANGFGTSASFECGSFIRFSLAVDANRGVIADARFQTNGCGYMMAAADAIAVKLTGLKLSDLGSLDEIEYEHLVEAELGRFPLERRQCLRVTLEAVRAAFADHRAFLIEEFSGEKALICTCFGVSEDTIERFIAAESPETVDDVTAACRAGGGCGSCRMIIQEMIDKRPSELAV